jgi:hypothetical protein
MVIDSKIGGMGDVWMRLLALYTLSEMVHERHTLIVTPAIAPLAQAVFGDRITVETAGKADVVYTHYGLRHLLPGMFRGTKYVHPFHWILRETSKQTNLKEWTNGIAINLAAQTGRLLLPARRDVWEYQGFMELTALDPFAHVKIVNFKAQSSAELGILSAKLQALFPHPEVHRGEIVVFPSGTAHQIMPSSFAKKYLPSAIFAFHSRDLYASEYAAEGLQIVTFSSPEEMLKLGSNAQIVVCTDSFPSHLWQTWGTRILIVLSQQSATQVVHPGFSLSQVIQSEAVCVRCRSRVRLHPQDTCDAGRVFCETWTNPRYIQSFCEAVQSALSGNMASPH